jgi:tetratricopeptide (TPR) repeat protein
MNNDEKKTLPSQTNAPAQHTEKMLLERLQKSATPDEYFRWLLFIVGYYRGMDRLNAAKALLQRFVATSENHEHRVHCFLALGQIATDEKELESAVKHFNAALELEPAAAKVKYVLYNNIGYCLNALGHYPDGERHCRKALEIDWVRASAYRNLGVSFHGQSNLLGAAWALAEAAKADPADDRARVLMTKLLTDNPALFTRCPWVTDVLDPSATTMIASNAGM